MNVIEQDEKAAVARAEDVPLSAVTPEPKTAEPSTALAVQPKRELKRDPLTGKFAGTKTKRKAEALQRALIKAVTSKRPGSNVNRLVEATTKQLELAADNTDPKFLAGSAKMIETAHKISVGELLKEPEPNRGITVVHIPSPQLMHPEVIDEKDDPWRNKPSFPSFAKPAPEPAQAEVTSISTNPAKESAK